MGKYDDIINLPHHTSQRHPRMSLQNRAAQFSPFAALTGHSEAIRETQRLTDSKTELDRDAIEIMDRKLKYLQDNIKNRPQAAITYFVPDERKTGGCYVTATVNISKIDSYESCLVTTAGNRIPVRDIYAIELL